MSKKLSACESALVSMVRQYCYRPLDANKEPAVDIYQHDFMSAGEEAFACLVNRGLAEWTDERRYAIRLTERADNPVRISPPSWLDYWWQESAIKRLAAERDEARAWARRMKRERDEARDLLGMMDVDKIAENLEKMRRWLK